ncbi:hypothetical protein B9Z55_007948 [Caenorhabditis nigoni]|uniref:Uncharacterized protein n=1 Tax=Caenorhabditis nigoni TaxID=1611254 RepID=A0A2G5VC18_9PELO|nr:hypothetical protein B9Z55_007948 [Caenorhabditis nigoni]
MFQKMRLLFLALHLALIFPLVFSDLTGSEFMQKMNEKRREFAKKEKIPNMRELRPFYYRGPSNTGLER